jgi:hypothetical protein
MTAALRQSFRRVFLLHVANLRIEVNALVQSGWEGKVLFGRARMHKLARFTYRVSTSSNTRNVCVSSTPGIDCS